MNIFSRKPYNSIYGAWTKWSHSAEVFFNFPVPLVTLTLSSFALSMMACLQIVNGWVVPFFTWEVVCKFSAIGSIVHKEQFNFFLVTNKQLFESIGEDVPCLSGILHSNLWHGLVSSELSSNSAINTMGFSPWFLKKLKNPHLLQLSWTCLIGTCWGVSSVS